MYAIVKTGGKQYKVAVGDVIDVELLDGDSVDLQPVLVVDGVELPPGNHVVPHDGVHGVTVLDLPVRWDELQDSTRLRLQLEGEPLDDGRYGLDAIFQGASGYQRMEQHEHELKQHHVPHSVRQELGGAWAIRLGPLRAVEVARALGAFVY